MRNLLGLKSWNRPLGFMARPLPAFRWVPPLPRSQTRRLAGAFSWWTAAGRRPGPASGPRHLEAETRARAVTWPGRKGGGRGVRAGALPVTREAGRRRASASGSSANPAARLHSVPIWKAATACGAGRVGAEDSGRVPGALVAPWPVRC